ncbi:hypothetical protein FACS1894184_00600 [Clostridia bacterium]|nr:hypothetical protein FACS1894184_00600 [Clostridia bacterium]
MPSTVMVYCGGGGSTMGWPGIGYSGLHTRHFVQYNDLWYSEYMLLASGTLTADGPYIVDVYLVGGGGRGATSSEDAYVWYRGRPGGGSGYPASALEQLLNEGAHSVVVGGTSQGSSIHLRAGVTIEAAAGGDAAAGSAAPQAGIGFTGEYRLYGDEAYPRGNGGGATSPVDVGLNAPGRGGGGCTVIPGIKPAATTNWRLSAGSNRVNMSPVEANYGGFGAGAMGGLPLRAFTDTVSAVAFSPEAAPGVVMLRIQM